MRDRFKSFITTTMASIDFRALDDTVYSHLFKKQLRDYPTPILLPLEADDSPPLHAPQQDSWTCKGPLRITGIIRPSGGVRMICVYSGELEEDGSTREVAVKLGDCDELWDEVDIFGKLKSLQGTGIPRLIALFRVKKIKRGYFGCLITERFGDFMQEPLCDLDRSVKYVFDFIVAIFPESKQRAKLMTYLADFHRLGVALKDISSRHVLISAGDVRIGNLEEGVHHHCQREATYDFLEAPIYLKDGEDIGLCYWLKSQADKMSFWEPSMSKMRCLLIVEWLQAMSRSFPISSASPVFHQIWRLSKH